MWPGQKSPGTPSIPASEADHLSAAVAEEERESAHGEESQRAEEAWDAIPGEEQSVDFEDAGIPVDAQVESKDLTWSQASGKITAAHIHIPGDLGEMLSVGSEPELTVDIYINHPDGRRWSLDLAVPGDLHNGDILAAISDHFDAVEALLISVLPTPSDARRSALGLTPHE